MIRLARLSDTDDILELLTQAGEEITNYGSSYTKEDLFTNLENYICDIYLKFFGDVPVGILIVYDLGCTGYIDILYVAKEHRNSGAGRDLIEHLLKSECRPGWRTLEFCFADGDIVRSDWAQREGFEVKSPVRWAVKELEQ